MDKNRQKKRGIKARKGSEYFGNKKIKLKVESYFEQNHLKNILFYRVSRRVNPQNSLCQKLLKFINFKA